MTDQIRTAYRDLEAEARDYADPDRALATARRRRRTRIAATALLVPLVAGSLAIGAALRPDAKPAPPPPAATISIADPGVLQPPATPVPLPRRAVAPAALVYAPCANGCAALVALTDGRQFAVPPDPDGVYAGSLSLSPDGAWLGYPVAGEYLIRDLTGTRVHRLPAPSGDHRIGVAAWYPDSTKVLLAAEPRIGGEKVHSVLDVVTGAVTAAPVPAGGVVVGVLPDGAVLYRATPGAGREVSLSTTDGRTFPIDLGDRLKAGESVPAVYLTRDGGGVYVIVASAEPGTTAAVVAATLGGQVRARQELSTPGSLWEPVGAGPDGMVCALRADSADATRTTLVTVSADGPRQGLVLLGAGTPDGGAPVARLPG